MPSYKLIYFKSKGRAEAIRLAFAVAGVEYTDERLESEEWQKLKPNMKGSNIDEHTQVDAVLWTLEDVFQSLGKIFGEKDEAKKNEIREEFRKNTVPGFLKYLRQMLDANKDNGWLVGSKVSIADLAWFQCSEFIQILLDGKKTLEDDLLKDEPALKAHRQKVLGIERLKKYIANRPVTQF